MSKLETNTVDSISGTSTLTLGGSNASVVSAGTEVRLFTSSQAQYFESTTTENYWHAYTPMVTSGFLDANKTTVDLFKFHTLADGDNTNTDYKISIANLREVANIDGEEQYSKQHHKKYDLQSNTCEGIAALEKSVELIKRCTFIGNEPFDFQSVDINHVLMTYHSMLLSEEQVRELARNEPWKALWTLNETNTVNLFMNQDRELSIDQKNILIWSRMYDNIQESMDCPSDDVIADDDMLDGWFIVQRKKQEKERAERELDSSTKNSKITNADEVFVMAGSQNDIDRINTMNSTTGQMTKKERMAVIQKQGEAKDLDFRDQQLKVRRQSNEQYKGKFGR